MHFIVVVFGPKVRIESMLKIKIRPTYQSLSYKYLKNDGARELLTVLYVMARPIHI